MKEFQAIVVDNQDPKGRNRVKVRVVGHHPGDLPVKELPWITVKKEIGANSGKGKVQTLTVGQYCTVSPLNESMTEWQVVAGSNAFRDPKNKSGKPYSVIENSELFSVPIPDLASCDPSKLARTVFVPLMEKLTKRISEPVKPFKGVCGTINENDPTGCGGGQAGCGGPGVPPPGPDGTCPEYAGNPNQKPLPPEIVCVSTCGTGCTDPNDDGQPGIDCRKYGCIVGCKPVVYSMKYDIQKRVQGPDGDFYLTPCTEDDVDIRPKWSEPYDPKKPYRTGPDSGCQPRTGTNGSCDGIDSGCNKRVATCNGMTLCLPENIPCSATYIDANGEEQTSIETKGITLVVTNKLNPNQPPLEIPCYFSCGNNACPDAQKLPGGAQNPYQSDDPFALGLAELHNYTGNKPVWTIPLPETGKVESIEIDLNKMAAAHPVITQEDFGFVPTAIKSKINSIRNLHQQTLASIDTIKKLPSIVYGQITYEVGTKMSALADKYINEIFGNLVDQANRILGEVQASYTRALNTSIEGAIKVVDNAIGTAMGEIDEKLGGVEKILIKPIEQTVGGFGLGAVPGAFFHETIRTDFLGEVEKKIVTQYENGIATVVDQSRGNKTWSVATNDGARIEICSNGSTLVKGANDVQLATEKGTVAVTGAHQITIVDGKATIHCKEFSVKAESIDMVATKAFAIQGDVEISGKLGIGKTIEVKKDVWVNGDVVVKKPTIAGTQGKKVSLFSHTHNVPSAPGDTNPPK